MYIITFLYVLHIHTFTVYITTLLNEKFLDDITKKLEYQLYLHLLT